MRSVVWILVTAVLASKTAGAQTLKIVPENVLYRDMEVTNVGPFVSSAQNATGVVWSQRIVHQTAVPAVRIHVQVRQGRPAADWRIVFLDIAGQVVESIPGGSPLLSSGGIWSTELRGKGGEVQLVSDGAAQGLQIAIDRYAYQVIVGVPQSISGIDQRIPIRRAPADVKGWAPPIARLSFIKEDRQYVCTGFLMTADLLMTNEHCLGTPEIAVSALADFGYDASNATPRRVRVSKLEAVDPTLDYAIVRLSEPLGEFGRVTLGDSTVVDGENLVIVEHPGGEFKQASIDDCKVRRPSLTGVAKPGTDFGHLCDTLGGSSGSPVMDRQSGKVIGLHHFGFIDGSPDPVNQGVHMNQIIADVRQRFPQLFAELTRQ